VYDIDGESTVDGVLGKAFSGIAAAAKDAGSA
jgi:hypothetical protein